MAIQTQQLIESLPNFASFLRAADAKGSSAWQIIQWSSIDPADVKPDQVVRPDELRSEAASEPNRFSNRTQALRYSKAYITRFHPHAKETGHWGVWKWVENGITRYQSVAPIFKVPKPGADTPMLSALHPISIDTAKFTASPPPAPVAAREERGEAYNSMVRVSAESNRRLREIAAEDKTTLQSVLDSAVKEYYRTWFFHRADAAYDALRKNEAAWGQEMAERTAWDATLSDGLDCSEDWHEDGSVHMTPTKAGNHG